MDLEKALGWGDAVINKTARSRVWFFVGSLLMAFLTIVALGGFIWGCCSLYDKGKAAYDKWTATSTSYERPQQQ